MKTLFQQLLEPILAELPEDERRRAFDMLHDVISAGGPTNRQRAIDAFLDAFGSKRPKAAAKLVQRRERLLAGPTRHLDEELPGVRPVFERVLAELPVAEHDRARQLLRDVFLAGRKANFTRAVDAFVQAFASVRPDAISAFTDAIEPWVWLYNESAESFWDPVRRA